MIAAMRLLADRAASTARFGVARFGVARFGVARFGVAPFAVAVALCSLAPHAASAQQLRRPFACDSCIANWFYFDEGGGSAVQDWNCAASSYDGHRGSDFSLRGGNAAIDAGHDVVAAADGEVVSTQDGFFDRCTSCGGSGCGLDYGYGFGNHIVINHGSYRVIYAHLRNGSVRVAPGDRVVCGQVIGQIGSSGCSTGAHLHFETRPLGGGYMTAFDPFEGPCSPTSPTLWREQGPYRGIPGASCGAPTPTCPSGTYPIWTCNAERTQRRRCIDGVDMIEDCPWGCVVMPVGTDDVCAPPPDRDGDGAAADVDCDDARADVRPGAPDVCGDGVDQDCSGGDATCPEIDAGSADLDAGLPADGGSAGFDAGPARDAGWARDTGMGAFEDASSRDGAPRGVDAGLRADRMLVGGCACRAFAPRPTARSLALAALLLVGLARTVRRARRDGRFLRRSRAAATSGGRWPCSFTTR